MGANGGLSVPVFWSLEPYPGRPDFHGEQLIHGEALYRVGRRAHELGWQLGIVLEWILAESPREDHRHFLHHATVRPPEATLQRMAELGIGVAAHPSWTTTLGAYAEETLQGEGLQTQNTVRSYLEHGIRVSLGSDQLPYSPIFNIWNDATRRGWDGEVYGPEEAITVEEGIRLHTLGVAYQNFDEDVRGPIEPGKLADMAVLGADILSVAPEQIGEIRVERTIIHRRTRVFVRPADIHAPCGSSPLRLGWGIFTRR